MSRANSVAFAQKLGLLMRVLGIVTHKQLYIRLKEINPGTGYRPELAYKWANGVASPRDPSVYDDLATLVDLNDGGYPVSGSVLRACSYQTFHGFLVAQYGTKVPKDEVEPSNPASTRQPTAERRGPEHDKPEDQIETPSDIGSANTLPAYIAGAYFVLSNAWSTLQRRYVLCGELIIRARADGTWMASYLERLPGGDLIMTGQIFRIGRSLQVTLVNTAFENVLAMTFLLPHAPGAVLSGIMSGTALHDTDMRPSAGRVLCIGMPYLKSASVADTATPNDRIGFGFAPGPAYLEGTTTAIANRLEVMGLDRELALLAASDVLPFLTEDGEAGVIQAGGGRTDAITRVLLQVGGRTDEENVTTIYPWS
ncbi:hypothetical protein [Thalassobaculum litoreum]|uniref:Uncharacterized protein n=1 Tax=Thalassobaculum litoreum DSM 18839 TaxID=1123362 RepID=A0A8G2BMU5_9PROT|nr:hypothetical protein [Thalassobaculum litoreum]SDG60518.1 hypothetical protein SAMN05660686_04996 [Thalassobaculum litoreum DSM 18839]